MAQAPRAGAVEGPGTGGRCTVNHLVTSLAVCEGLVDGRSPTTIRARTRELAPGPEGNRGATPSCVTAGGRQLLVTCGIADEIATQTGRRRTRDQPSGSRATARSRGERARGFVTSHHVPASCPVMPGVEHRAHARRGRTARTRTSGCVRRPRRPPAGRTVWRGVAWADMGIAVQVLDPDDTSHPRGRSPTSGYGSPPDRSDARRRGSR